MNTPTIFLSAATDDLRDWRDILHKAFERAGCKVYTQGHSLGASTAGVPELLRQHLDKSDFVIHLAGMTYGAEPEQPAFPGHPDFKCSYTQFEYYYAHLRGKNVLGIVCAENFPYPAFTEKAKDDAGRPARCRRCNCGQDARWPHSRDGGATANLPRRLPARGADAQVGRDGRTRLASRHRPRPPHAGPRRALRGDSGKL